MINEKRFNELSARIHAQLEAATLTGTESQQQNAQLFLEYIDYLIQIINTKNGQIMGHELNRKKFQDAENYFNQMIKYKAILRAYGFDPFDELTKYEKAAKSYGAFN